MFNIIPANRLFKIYVGRLLKWCTWSLACTHWNDTLSYDSRVENLVPWCQLVTDCITLRCGPYKIYSINLLKQNGLWTLTITKLVFVEAHFLFGKFVTKLKLGCSKNIWIKVIIRVSTQKNSLEIVENRYFFIHYWCISFIAVVFC